MKLESFTGMKIGDHLKKVVPFGHLRCVGRNGQFHGIWIGYLEVVENGALGALECDRLQFDGNPSKAVTLNAYNKLEKFAQSIKQIGDNN